MSAVSQAGTVPFTSFAGFIYENTTSTATGNPLTSVFQVAPGTCYLGAGTLPIAGSVDKSILTAESFPVNGQSLHVSATENGTGTELTGSYQVSGGCAGGDTGTLTGEKYDPLAGVYSGTIGIDQPAPVASLALMQAQLGDGRGYSDITGTATFTNIPCFASAALTAPNSYVVGKTVELTFTASDGETVTMAGTFNQAATALSIAHTDITGGACSGSLGGGTFSHL